MEKLIVWLKDLSKEDIALVGGKGANLGEMYNNGFPVPNAFVITSQAYDFFLEKANIKEKIFSILREINVNDSKQLQEKSKEIREIIINAELPSLLKEEIIDAYHALAYGDVEKWNIIKTKNIGLIKVTELPFVAVRSSATAEDLPNASFAGQQATFLNVKGEENLIKAVKKCIASLFTARAIFYREQNNFSHEKVKLAVIVQKMVDSEKAGVAFSINPATNETNEIVIEAAFGLGEAVVSGKVNPDLYIVDKNTLEIKEKIVRKQEFLLTRDPLSGENIKVNLNEEKGKQQKLTDEEIIKLAKIVREIEKHYNFPQDIEWAVENGKIYIVQSRPVTTIKKVEKEEVKGEVIVKGIPASPGIASGKAKIIMNASEIYKIEKGDVLITKMTDPDFVPAMKRAVAIVTDEGGMTSHAAIVSRELQIPCVVGCEKATSLIKDGEIITVNGYTGEVYRGVIKEGEKKEIKEEKVLSSEEIVGEASELSILSREIYEEEKRKKVKLYMNLGVPEKITEYKHLPFEGIGLMRIEFVIASQIGLHPLYAIKIGKKEEYIEKLKNAIVKVAKEIYPKPMIVRFSDFKSNEYKRLKGGMEYEPEEENPMLGWRGVSRYVSEEFVNAFKMELEAIKRARENYNNIHVMLPFVRTIKEVKEALSIMKEHDLERKEDFKVYLMAEVPSVILLADRFSLLCDGFSIGSNDLTQLILGVDRDNSKLGKLGYFNERNEAVLIAIKKLINDAHRYGKTVSICGQAPSIYEDFTKFLIKSGIDSISVNPDAVIKVKNIIDNL